MRASFLVAPFLVALVVGVASASSSVSTGSARPTSLTVSYRAKGDSTATPTRWVLRCNPRRGSLPHPAVACARLAASGWKVFAPVPKGVLCTEIYGGPQVAIVTGTVAGRRVFARFSRVDGCQLARWNRVSPWLLPRGGVS